MDTFERGTLNISSAMNTILNMHSYFRAFFVLALVIILFSCKKEESNDPPPLRTYQDLENDFDAIDISDEGIDDVSLKATSFLTWDVRIISPGIVEGQSYPLVFTLHGAANGSPTAHQQTACLAEPGLEALGAIIVSPNGYLNQWYEPENQQQILTLINLAKEYWPIDTNKIAITGYSNGGNGSWFYAEVFPEIFSASIPMASSYNTYLNAGDTVGRFIETPLYVIHGENDELFPLINTEEWVTATEAAGTDVTLVVAPGLSHTEPCEYVSYLQDASQWLINDIWN